MFRVALSLLLALALLLGGCSKKEAPKAPPAPGTELSGVVVETMDADNRTYALLDRGIDQRWVGGPMTPLKVGSRVRGINPQPPQKFVSKGLRRTFDKMEMVNAYEMLAPALAVPAGSAKTAKSSR